ncbi:MAG: DUF934 domain-containing protein [Pseudomonadota bacterium]
MVIVTDKGFGPDTWDAGFAPAAANDTLGKALDIASDFDPRRAGQAILHAPMLRIDFPNFADGRGFTIAAQLRRMGYNGRLRARGHIIADQYAMARRAGFDEIEISDDLAARQDQSQWLARADWRAHHYQNRLMAAS